MLTNADARVHTHTHTHIPETFKVTSNLTDIPEIFKVIPSLTVFSSFQLLSRVRLFSTP